MDNEIELLKGSGKILIMDDDQAILEVASYMLTTLGYSVQVAHHGDEAIDAFKQALSEKAPFDAVILDLTIPGGKGGVETIQALRTLDKNLKAIVSSGYAVDPVISNYEEFGFSAAVQKPYKIEEMARAVQSVMDHQQ